MLQDMDRLEMKEYDCPKTFEGANSLNVESWRTAQEHHENKSSLCAVKGRFGGPPGTWVWTSQEDKLYCSFLICFSDSLHGRSEAGMIRQHATSMLFIPDKP